MQNTIKNLSEDILKLICLLTHRNKQNTSTGEKYQMGFVVLSWERSMMYTDKQMSAIGST